MKETRIYDNEYIKKEIYELLDQLSHYSHNVGRKHEIELLIEEWKTK